VEREFEINITGSINLTAGKVYIEGSSYGQYNPNLTMEESEYGRFVFQNVQCTEQ
jgi:hypothetical protein